MPKSQQRKKSNEYTYRAGKKVALNKRRDQFVVRHLPDEVMVGDTPAQVSSASSRVSCKPADLDGLMAQSRQSAVTHHAYEVVESGEEFLITDRIIVSFEHPLTPEAVGAFAGKYALEIVLKYSETKYLFRLTTATGMNPVKLVVKLVEGESQVARVEHDLNMRFNIAIDLPTDPNYPDQWHLHQRSRHSEFDERSSSRCEAAWNLLGGFGDPEVVVGVTDDGCKLDHIDFNSPTKFTSWAYLEGIRLLHRGDPDASPDKMYQPGANHGTACAGVIAAEVDAEMTVGAAPASRLLPIKWESQGPSLFISDSKLLIVLNYVANRVDVLSNSWGGAPVSRWSRDVRERIEELALSGGRRGKGILFLWAAGNENCPINHQADQPVPFTNGWELINGSWEWVGAKTSSFFSNDLVNIPGVMHIGALASTAQRSHYSNYGPGVDICAPSSNSHAYFRMQLDGLSITTTTGQPAGVRHTFGGTSSATPLAAGIAALVISANPGLTALEVASILRRTASKNLDMTGYPRTPAMIDDPNPTWDVSPIAPFDRGDFSNIGSEDGTWSPWFGHGKVDALEAVSAALAASSEQTTRVRVELNPNLAIPDRDPAGVVSRVFMSDAGQVKDIKIFVDIAHTYIGDLIVRLTGPQGVRVDLHNRDGGGADNLVQTFTLESVPSLAAFLGTAIKGTWTLEVSDHAQYDTGHLRKWTLEAEVLADTARRFESAPGRTIPDQDPVGITDHITVTELESVKEIAVDIDITHTYIGDLRVAVSNPRNHEVVLHAQEGRSADDIQRTYTVDEEPALRDFIGQSGNGDWVLSVSDNARRDVGKLNRWSLTLR